MSDEEYDLEYSGDSDSEMEIDSDSERDSDSDSSDVDVAQARRWQRIDSNNPPPNPPRFPFLGTPSVNLHIDDDKGILQFIEYFFDDSLIGLICEETNRYYNEYNITHPRTLPFDELKPNELRVFLGLVILQGIIKKPEMEQYWSKNPILATPFFGDVMSHRRFKLIKQFLHFSNNAAYDPQNHPCPKLNKVWPVLSYLIDKFKSAVTPERDITIDESLLLYKGRLSWIQYIPNKRSRFGIKSYMLCESKSGYVWNFILYTGRGTLIDNNVQGNSASTKVVLTLMKDLLSKGYCLTTDNFYSSPELADILLLHQTDMYGTVRLSRKDLPPKMRKQELKKLKMKPGDIVGYQRGKLTVMAWKDKKIVSLLSTLHTTKMVDVEQRLGVKKRPESVIAYNDTMGGVDRVDQHLASYSTPRKRGKKYYKKIFLHLLDLALWNSFVIYTKQGGQLSSLEYRLKLVEKIMETYHTDNMRQRAGRPSNTPNPLRLTERHFPEYIPPTEKKMNPTRQCAMCSRVRDARGKKIRRESRYYCPDCNVPLCVTPCFRVYHTVADI